MNTRLIKTASAVLTIFPLLLSAATPSQGATGDDFVAVPPFVTSGAPPLVMLVMGRNHKLFYEAYNDASDLDGDDVTDITYLPDAIDYYGYFDSYKCYEYSDTNSRFEPSSVTTDKKCTGDEEWSGDFLNYITMTRMDTIRRVLYGGYRSTDTEDETVLERVYVPQDAHSWGKEYTSEEVNGYDISDYTPLDQPVTVGDTTYRHIFASTTLASYNEVYGPNDPILRVAQNTTLRVWEWVSTEGHAAQTSYISTGTTTGSVSLPTNHADFEEIVTAYAQDNPTFIYGSASWLDNWDDRNQQAYRYPDSSASDFGAIDGEGNPYGNEYKDTYNSSNSEQNYYLSVFTGTINITTAGTYYFAVDGDDSVEVIIDGGTKTNDAIAGIYSGHAVSFSGYSTLTDAQVSSVDAGRATTYTNDDGDTVDTHIYVSIYLDAGEHTIEFRQMESAGNDRYYLYWKQPSDTTYSIVPNSAFTSLMLSTYRTKFSVVRTLDDYDARVKVCDSDIGLEDNCKEYSYEDTDGATVTTYKPIGILQRYGETDRMYFGLMSGSWTNNMNGGVLRKNISNISDEIDSNTGILTDDDGIIGTINKFRIYGYGGSTYGCQWPYAGPMDVTAVKENKNCHDWGNPIAEMMYETVRYFAGKKTPTSEYTYSGTEYGLPLETWKDPYETYESCSAPYMLVISDINPTFDTDDLPGVDSEFSDGISTDLTDFDLNALMDKITATDSDIVGSKYIGQSVSYTDNPLGLSNTEIDANGGTGADGTCSEKDVDGFDNIRGLCPEEPTKKGGYYSAGIAYYGHETDLSSTADDDQKLTTYTVGLASPLPRIELNVGENHITAVPFAKSVSGGSISTYKYYMTNTIVDFYVTELTDTYGKFRINYEDVEEGADHDMDMIVIYEYQLIDDDGNAVDDSADATKVKFTLTSEYAYGGIEQHAGYIISGTTADGVYLEVKDEDTTTASSFYLDTPQDDDSTVNGTKRLNDYAERVFTPRTSTDSSAAELVENPLWYAAKWGGFNDKDSSGSTGYSVPDSDDEWDSDGDGDPDNYFYVTNPTELESQLNKSFAAILASASSGTAASVISNSREGEGAIYQTIFFPTKTDSTDNTNTITWAGQVHSLLIDSTGNIREDSNQNKALDVEGPDLNGDGVVYNEDINMNCVLDEVDTDGDGTIDYTEDADGDGVLDYESDTGSCITADDPADHPFMSQLDAILVFDGTDAQLYYDVDGDEEISAEEKLWNVAGSDVDSEDINYLWNSNDWLNSDELVTTTQRSTYISNSHARYIFTWVDGDDDGLVDSSEVLDFIWPTTDPDVSELSDTAKFYAYLNLYPSFANRPDAISQLISDDETNSTSYFNEFLLAQTKREINWIRGLDDVDESGSPQLLTLSDGSGVSGTYLRSRMYDGKTWRLGDIAYSTPTVVASPSENFHLLYQDSTYATFYTKYENRRNVVYAGANDGMVHAFNAGFYDDDGAQFCQEMNDDYDPNDNDTTNDVACKTDSEMPELGAELWAYIPFNLLPHLYWLTDPDYGHSYYVDLKPRVFDAKIFTAEKECKTDTSSDDCIHPEGWGTIMVVGMRFGGSTIVADVDKTDGKTQADDDVTMKSSYMIFDITNPEEPPTLMAEFSMPEMGYSLSYPTMAILKDANHDGVYDDYQSSVPTAGENRWFLAFGSGPADAYGNPDSSILDTAESSHTGHYYLIDMVKLGTEGTLYSLTAPDDSAITGQLTEGLYSYVDLEANSFVDSSVSVDYDLDFNTDALYFGTVSGSSSTGYAGKMRRIVIDDQNDGDDDTYPTNWIADSVLYDAGRPIVALATIAQDKKDRNWIYFGTGRYYVDTDNDDLSLQSYYGIKEPIDDSDNMSWTTVLKTELMDVTDMEVSTAGKIYVNGSLTSTWSSVTSDQSNNYSGWYVDLVDFDATNSHVLVGERNLGQATLVGGLLTFTSFIPSDSACDATGESYLWALYYSNGLPYYTGILGTETKTADDQSTYSRALSKMSLGEGLSTTANVHVGSEDGSSIYVQTSTGEIQKIDVENPETTKSSMQSWKRD